jgi:prephenate dehydrogenase
MFNTVTIVGVGLISGSFSLALKEKGLVKKVIGVSRTAASAQKALDLGLIDEVLPLEQAVAQSDLIYVAIPVDATIPVMKQVMDLLTDQQIVVDAGSTKHALCAALANHPMGNALWLPTPCGVPSTAGLKPPCGMLSWAGPV